MMQALYAIKLSYAGMVIKKTLRVLVVYVFMYTDLRVLLVNVTCDKYLNSC